MKMFEKNVIKGGARPKIDPKWNDSIKKFLQESFVDNPKRPSMAEACELLRDEINDLADDEIGDALDISGKSNHSKHG